MGVLAQPLDNRIRFALRHLALHFPQREMHDVVVMNLFTWQLVAQFQPDSVQQVNFVGREPRRVRAEIENLFLAGRRENFQRDARPRLGHVLPGEPDFAGLFGHGHFR